MSRKFGLTIDRMVAAEIVLADGSVRRVEAGRDPDLFWAIRGAGGNFGIVTAFEFEASEVGNVGVRAGGGRRHGHGPVRHPVGTACRSRRHAS